MLVSLFLQEMGSHLHMGSKVGKGKQSPEFTRCLDESEAAAEGTERKEAETSTNDGDGKATKTPENIRQKSRTAENKEVNRMDVIAIFY